MTTTTLSSDTTTTVAPEEAKQALRERIEAINARLQELEAEHLQAKRTIREHAVRNAINNGVLANTERALAMVGLTAEALQMETPEEEEEECECGDDDCCQCMGEDDCTCSDHNPHRDYIVTVSYRLSDIRPVTRQDDPLDFLRQSISADLSVDGDWRDSYDERGISVNPDDIAIEID